MKVELDNRTPVYMQIIHHYKSKIASGEIESNAEMPSRREVASYFKVNPNTVQRAFKEMETEGFIFTEGNSLSRVTKDESILENIREELLTDAVNELVRAVKPIKVSLNELTNRVSKQYIDFDDSEGGQGND